MNRTHPYPPNAFIWTDGGGICRVVTAHETADKVAVVSRGRICRLLEVDDRAVRERSPEGVTLHPVQVLTDAMCHLVNRLFDQGELPLVPRIQDILRPEFPTVRKIEHLLDGWVRVGFLAKRFDAREKCSYYALAQEIPVEPDGPVERDFPGENPFYAPGDLERDRLVYPGIHPDF